MENAADALIIAGGVLIGVLILSLAIYLIVDFGQTSADINTRIIDQRLVEFNTNFTVYDGRKDLTIYDIMTVAGFAHENNVYYENNADYKVTVKCNNVEIQDYTIDDINNKIKNEPQDPLLKKYQCKKIEYHDNGRVKSVIFRQL